jgi:multiple sugar transport system ATP-binding protein
MGTQIVINNLTKRFGKTAAVNDVSLTVENGTFLTLLGPSGCGKTTLLRCLAGLEDPDGGDILIGDKLVFSHSGNFNSPGKRDDWSSKLCPGLIKIKYHLRLYPKS